MIILITGSSGFIGQALTLKCVSSQFVVRGATRKTSNLSVGAIPIFIENINEKTDWSNYLLGCDVIIHLAARAHVLNDRVVNPLEEFRRINCRGTLNLARQAAEAGIKRFVFISSIGVHGAETYERPFFSDNKALPHSPYAVSKYEAEIGLREIALETGMQVVIIRPPLVYGPNAPGNFGALLNWVKKGIPLPLGAIHDNRRSFVALDNLIDLIITCITHPAAANQTFLVSDGEDLSTTDLLRRIASAMGRPSRLIPIPSSVLKAGASLLGKKEMAQRLLGSLQVDIEKTRRLLNWAPPISVDEGLRRAVAGI